MAAIQAGLALVSDAMRAGGELITGVAGALGKAAASGCLPPGTLNLLPNGGALLGQLQCLTLLK